MDRGKIEARIAELTAERVTVAARLDAAPSLPSSASARLTMLLRCDGYARPLHRRQAKAARR